MKTEFFTLNQQYSTTRRLTHTRPTLINQPEDQFESVLFLPENPERKAEGGLRTQGYFKSGDSDKPLISVITVVFNGEQYLEQTIKSVIEQSYDNVEYIIIDGGSTDGTLDIIKKYEGAIDYWVSERDEGISDAFNKGITLCTGEIIGIINADDWYEKESFKIIIKHINHANVLYGNMNLLDNSGNKIAPKVNHRSLNKNMSICHPSCFVKKEIYKKNHIYDKSFKYAMDYDLLLNLYLENVSFYNINIIISNMRDSGISNTMWIKALKEIRKSKKSKRIHYTNYSLYYYFYFFKQAIRHLLQSIGLNIFVTIYRNLTTYKV